MTLPFRTFSFMAASCAESMYAMFVAFALFSQFERAMSAFAHETVSEMSKSDPFAFFRFNPLRSVRQAGSLAHRMALPFLFDQKPIVSPPPPPRHRLPKVQV